MAFFKGILQDWPRKLVSVLFALLIWGYVQLQIQDEEIFRNVTVELEHRDDQIVLDQQMRPCAVTVRGPKRKLQLIGNADIRVVARVPAGHGPLDVPLLSKHVRAPSGVRIIAVQPERLRVFADKVKAAEKPLRIAFRGELPPELEFKTKQLIPRVAQVTGPERTVDSITEILTGPVDLGNNPPEQFEQMVPLQKIPHVTISPDEVRVRIALYRRMDDRFYKELPVRFLQRHPETFRPVGFGDDAPPLVSVVIQGPKATVDILSEASLRPFVDLTDITAAGRYRRPVHCWINAEGCRVRQLEPMVIDVEVAPVAAP